MIDLNNHKLELKYPCSWCYKIVILNEHNANKIAKEVFVDREHTVTKSKVSSKGKFKSYNLEIIVTSDEDRTNFHKVIGEHKQVKMVV
jgi:putative lipoic acid-binding regulatory protein